MESKLAYMAYGEVVSRGCQSCRVAGLERGHGQGAVKEQQAMGHRSAWRELTGESNAVHDGEGTTRPDADDGLTQLARSYAQQPHTHRGTSTRVCHCAVRGLDGRTPVHPMCRLWRHLNVGAN